MQEQSSHTRCPICDEQAKYAFQSKLLHRYNVTYFCCPQCELLQTESPHWLEEAYSSAIASTDIGLLQRNFQISSILAPVLFFHDKHGKYLDYAGGYGKFCRLMRDIDFDFYTTDAYCTNLFAKDFEWTPDKNLNFSGITAMEVLEHVHNPLTFFEGICPYLTENGAIIFTTFLYRDNIPDKDWWYYSFNTGQHISFFTQKTLETLSVKLNMHFVSNGHVHMCSRSH